MTISDHPTLYSNKYHANFLHSTNQISFNQYLLSIYYVSGIALNNKDKTGIQTGQNPCPHGA